jgi:hypothetical protein
MKGAFFSVCGCEEGLAAVLLVTLGRRAPLGPMTDTLRILARLARRIARRSTTSVGLLVIDVMLLLAEVLTASWADDGCFLLDLRFSTGAVRIAAPAARASTPRSVALRSLHDCRGY